MAVGVALLGFILFCAWRLYAAIKLKNRIPAGAKPLPGPKSKLLLLGPYGDVYEADHDLDLPLIGRVHDVPAEAAWLKFYEWSKTYGPIYKHEMFGSVHVWISSEQVAHDLLGRRNIIYSDRPMIPNLPDNRTSGDYLALLGRTETWKRQRKLCHHLMNQSDKESLHAYPTRERDRFLWLLSQNPSEYREYIEQFTSRTVSRLSWGTAHPARVLRKTTFGLLQTISPAGALPNVISFLMHVPAAISPWKKKEKERHEIESRQFKSNVEYVADQVEKGTAAPSFISTFINEGLGNEKGKWGDLKEATNVVGLMAIAGALTIGSPIQSFLLAMLHYPEWQAKLQKEIDEVCEGRCPQWTDREKLPLLRAVVKEVIRWRPPVPTGIPHAVEKDDVYNGYFIPAGATIHALEWGITRDESIYPDAETFNPDRWLQPSYPTYKEPLTRFPNLDGFSQFGFGRRTCQGVPIVDQDLFLTMGGMAWAFDIRKKRNADGTEVPVHWNDYTPLLIAKPAYFDFDTHIRTPEKADMLKAMFEAAKEEEEHEEQMMKLGMPDIDVDKKPSSAAAISTTKPSVTLNLRQRKEEGDREKQYREHERDIPGCPGRWATEQSDIDSGNEKGYVDSDSCSGRSSPTLL
ncbi:O-methylsterigmatocystin oxidoreductase 4 [Colletotrichum chlorophyti]|uniref:O-methylsterigmatocystin oxidoreductase 4 n=1 Tax=Colletotrichum chlorophyti TaxID=708187 RepID=A0A1Q8RAP1_9PEZI|nr:O-methylsterigmatocystin oxidoreductase 4 [Colletotrichum chlorophyti]